MLSKHPTENELRASYPPRPNQHLYLKVDGLTVADQIRALAEGRILYDPQESCYCEAWKGHAVNGYFARMDQWGNTVKSTHQLSARQCVRAMKGFRT